MSRIRGPAFGRDSCPIRWINAITTCSIDVVCFFGGLASHRIARSLLGPQDRGSPRNPEGLPRGRSCLIGREFDIEAGLPQMRPCRPSVHSVSISAWTDRRCQGRHFRRDDPSVSRSRGLLVSQLITFISPQPSIPVSHPSRLYLHGDLSKDAKGS